MGRADPSKPAGREIVGWVPEMVAMAKYLLEKIEIFAKVAAGRVIIASLSTKMAGKEVVCSPAGMVLETYKESLSISS